MAHSEITKITARISERSAQTRHAYFERAQRAVEDKSPRSSISCSNLAHAVAACPAHDKSALVKRAAGITKLSREAKSLRAG